MVVTIQTPAGAESTVRSRQFAQAFVEALSDQGEERVAARIGDALAYKPGAKLVKVAATEAPGVSQAARAVAGNTDTPETWHRITAA